MATRIAAQPNPQRTIEGQLRAALAAQRQTVTDMNTYLAIASPTNAQILAFTKTSATAMKAQAQILIGLCRIVGKQLDATS